MDRRFRHTNTAVTVRIFCLIVMACAVAFSSSTAAVAEPDLLDLIKQHCSSSQFALQQIEKRDAVSRINRGRDYDQMIRQVSALNSRLAYNKINASDLLQLTTDLGNGVDKFRVAYDHYDSDMSEALSTNCKDKPADYYQVIVKARTDRSAVGDQVNAINDLMAQYRQAAAQYRDMVQ